MVSARVWFYTAALSATKSQLSQHASNKPDHIKRIVHSKMKTMSLFTLGIWHGINEMSRMKDRVLMFE